MMKTLLAFLLAFSAVTIAADPKPETIKKLGSVTWDLNAHKLTWVVQKGERVNGEFVPASEEKYEITPDDALMAVAQERRGFSEDEAETLHHLLDVLSLYCAESVVWWDQGQGRPMPDVNPSGQPEKTGQPEKNHTASPEKKPVKVRQPEPEKKKPAYKVADSDIVAFNRGLR